MNESKEELRKMYSDLEQAIRDYVSRNLMDTSEESPYQCYIPLDEGACGLSSLEMPAVTSIFQEEKEGIIWVSIDNGDYMEFDELSFWDRMSIAEDF